MRKTSMTHIVLQHLTEFGEGTLDAFFSPKHSRTAMWRPLLGLRRAKKIKKETISTILWRLKKQGLVERKGPKKIAQWQVTEKGRKKLHKRASLVSLPQYDGITRLVIFDIPEQERRKRDVIRAELIGCHFQQLQKSVWIGKLPVSEDFVTLIETLQLNDKVHIFSVRDQGTLEIKK